MSTPVTITADTDTDVIPMTWLSIPGRQSTREMVWGHVSYSGPIQVKLSVLLHEPGGKHVIRMMIRCIRVEFKQELHRGQQ